MRRATFPTTQWYGPRDSPEKLNHRVEAVQLKLELVVLPQSEKPVSRVLDSWIPHSGVKVVLRNVNGLVCLLRSFELFLYVLEVVEMLARLDLVLQFDF